LVIKRALDQAGCDIKSSLGEPICLIELSIRSNGPFFAVVYNAIAHLD
jgi:hypothetical protein